ncbi:ATP-dependent DNA helicase [Pseudoramibacter faecis]|uniref:ATP-dependent DNA helicase n=1 Tax=Pseudoramibacter faecis TaxID=3108534 RepID=UPI002E79E28F|nr:ATP-dependent DNA helicase [Pseudoramibacter sp. HA2172]
MTIQNQEMIRPADSFQEDARTIHLSVKDLVAFVLRSGSIDNRFGGFDRAQEGAAIHRRLQKMAGDHYEPEVTLRRCVCFESCCFDLQGRADGIIREAGVVLIDEIKTVSKDVMALTEADDPDFWAQVKLYGWMVAEEEDLESIGTQLTYYQVPSGTIRTFRQDFTRGELETFTKALLADFMKWVRLRTENVIARNRSLSHLTFPFARWRSGQREMAIAVYRSALQKRALLCQAPTGIGKTLAVLYGALAAIGRERGDRIFYATAKTTNALAAEKAAYLLQQQGAVFKSVTLTAKDAVCFLEKRECNPDACPYAAHYYDRAGTVVYEALHRHDHFDRSQIETLARDHALCPFELSLDLADWCDMIIGDYNYLFDPHIALERLSGPENDFRQTIALIDEAHNLPDRARGMFSAAIHKADALAVRKTISKQDSSFRKALTRLNNAFLALLQNQESDFEVVSSSRIAPLNESLQYACFACEAYTKAAREHGNTVDDLVMDWYFNVRRYLDMAEIAGAESVVTCEKKRKNLIVTQRCLDPSGHIGEKAAMLRTVIYFSATLVPRDYYAYFLGSGRETATIQLPSPFDADRFGVVVANHISTKYRDREASAEAVAQLIKIFVSGRSGNYLVFFPSYAYLALIVNRLGEDNSFELLVQDPTMTVDKREVFLSRFHEKNKKTLVGFCVLGGFFSEGIDLIGDQLIGAVIVGVGLPMVCPENNLLKQHFDERLQSGFDYAYRYPGMNKVIQAMGRVIRAERDRGMALLIDSRFSEKAYQSLLPVADEKIYWVQNAEVLRQAVGHFWS